MVTLSKIDGKPVSTGKPKKDKLIELGLDDIARDLWS